MKYPRIFTMKLIDCFEQYNGLKGVIITIKNIINKKTFMLLKKNIRKKKRIYYREKQVINRIKIACKNIESVLKKHAGKYIFSLYKKKK